MANELFTFKRVKGCFAWSGLTNCYLTDIEDSSSGPVTTVVSRQDHIKCAMS